jgi:hypothetical protein
VIDKIREAVERHLEKPCEERDFDEWVNELTASIMALWPKVRRGYIELFYHWQDKECPNLDHFVDELIDQVLKPAEIEVTHD